jgi:predicted dehydrogenase
MGEVHGRAFGRLRQHFPEVARTPRLVAVADPEPTRRDRAVGVYGFEAALADWRQLLVLDDVDVVSVCGPNFVHRDVAVAAAEAGKHVWVEKPAGRTLADTADIAAAVHAAGVRCAVGFNYRNVPAIELARDIVTSGELGAVEMARVHLLSDYAADPDGALSWRFDPEYAGTGVLGDLASHGLDLVRHVVGQRTGDITEVAADLATFITQRPRPLGSVSHYAKAAGGALGPVGNEDHVSALLRFESGARGFLESSRVAVGEQCTYGIEVRGERGALAWDFRRMAELRVCVGQGYQNAAWLTRFASPAHGEFGAFQPGAGIPMGFEDLKVIEAERLVRSIVLGKPVGATIDDAVVAATLIEAIVESYQERRWTRL